MTAIEKRPYRGSDNEKAQTHALSARPVRLVSRGDVPIESRPPLLPGRKSRRPRWNVWVPA